MQRHEGPLPGRRVDLPDAGYVGVVRATVHEVGAVGRGSERLALLLALDRLDGSLCVGYKQVPAPGFTNADFRCGVDTPVIVYAGRSGSGVEVVERASLVGVVGAGVRRLEVTYAGGASIPVSLRPLAGTGLRSFALDPGAPLPSALRAIGELDDVLTEISLASVAAPPCHPPGACVGADGPWSDAIDPTLG